MTPLRGVALALALAATACADGGGTSTPTAPAATATRQPATPATATVAPSPSPAAATAPALLPPRATATPGGPSITIAAVGDVSLARELVARMDAAGAGYPYALVLDLLAADVTVGNLEGALTERGEPWPKGYNFRTPPRHTAGLAAAGFDVVSLANNHAMDYGAVGLLDTVDALDAAGVRHAGAGRDGGAAYAPAIVDVRGARVAFVACVRTPTESGGFFIGQWAAGEGAPGVAICATDAVSAQVTSARAQADFVIVLAHMGDEYVRRPSVEQREVAEAALAAGADAFIGAHAHVVQPVEHRGGQLFAWGLGNFIFDLDPVDLANIPPPRVAPVLLLTLTPGAGVTSWQARAVTLDDAEDRPRPATAEEAAALDALLRP